MTRLQTSAQDVSNGLQVYLRDIKDDSLLSAAEERELAGAIAQGDKDARTRMIQANLRLVVKIARDYLGRGMVLEDLVGEGNLGLIRATEEFDPDFGTRFSTYASHWIKQSIRHALINTTSTIRLPAHMVGLLTKWRRAERSLARESGRAASFDEIATFLGLSEAQKVLVEKACQARQLKLESGMGGELGRWSPDDSRDPSLGPDAALEADDERKILARRMSMLDPRERMVLALRYGLGGETPLTLKEIGRRLGVTREWVRKIEIRAVRKLDTRDDQPPRDSRDATPGPRRNVASRRSRAIADPALAATTRAFPNPLRSRRGTSEGSLTGARNRWS